MKRIDNTEIYKKYFEESRGENNSSRIEVVPVITPEYSEELDQYSSLDNIDDIDRLVELLRMLLERAWGDECPIIVDEYPTNQDADNRVLPMIVYDYYDRRYAEKTKKGPNIIKANVSYKNEQYELLSEWFECKLQFDICALTTREAKVISKRFEIFMSTYLQYFKYLGIDNIYFYEQPKGKMYQLSNHDVPTRVLIYKVKLERRYMRKHGEALASLDVILNIDSSQNRSNNELPGVYSLLEKETTFYDNDDNK